MPVFQKERHFMSERAVIEDWPDIYRARRNAIREVSAGGVILWLGHLPQPRIYAAETYPFRQNSHFLYYTGISEPDLAVLTYPEKDYDILFSQPVTMDDVVWSGPGRTRSEMAREAGIEAVEDIGVLGSRLARARGEGLKIHYMPPCQASSVLKLGELLGMQTDAVRAGVSRELVEGVVRQRLVKEEVEIAEIEDALRVTDRMHRAAMSAARPGCREYEVAGVMQGVALAAGRQQAFTPIVTVHGEVLHNHSYDHVLEDGQLLLNDSGVESPRFYASDITRTCPVSGRFTTTQAEVYETVLRAQLAAIGMISPGVPYVDVHMHASRVMADGLREMGLIKGDAADVVTAGAHALFFPHGLGHMLGLDVHDMEDLGDIVGYPKGQERSKQFGRNFLRLVRCLEPGHVLTVEPGIYFIPALIDKWEGERRHKGFISYDKLKLFRNFGGIRIEDNVAVTAAGAKVLGPGIPKSLGEVETATRGR
jgi:Xaa-Pro aminopeptidase